MNDDKLRSFILNGLKKNKIKTVMMTRIELWRRQLLTKENMESYCKGKKNLKASVNDDLESFFENRRLGKDLEKNYGPNEDHVTYFLPRLTEEELELVERRDRSYYRTFEFSWNPDVNEFDMMHSESDSKYVEGWCVRSTFVIQNSCKISPETSSEN